MTNAQYAPSAESRLLHAWKLSLPAKEGELPTSKRLNELFQKAAKLVGTGEVGIQQEVLENLASPKGLRRVNEVIEQKYKFNEKPLPPHRIFTEQLLPLFTIIVRPDIASSFLLEQYVGALFQFLCGVTGERAEKILQWTTISLSSNKASDVETGELDVALKVICKFIARLIEINSTVHDKTTLHENVEVAAKLLLSRTSGTDCSQDAHEALVTLGRIQRLLDIDLSLPSVPKAVAHSHSTKAVFKIPCHPPGGRHDNDHEDFSKICILPTPDEIVSDAMEYLPTCDPNQNQHLQTFNGLLDRSFRLLREDTVGQLRDAVKIVIEALKMGASGSHHLKASVRHEKGTRVYSYHNVQLADLTYDDANGMALTVAFDQPIPFDTNAKRKDWWARTKHLDPEALVCLVDANHEVMFCTVHQHSKPKGNYNLYDRKIKDMQRQFEKLYKDPHRGQVSLQVITTSQRALKSLVNWVKRRGRGPELVLVEFPGVLLPAFQHTLEALKQMKEQNDVGLVQYLVPRLGEDMPVDVPPPTYTARAGFKFDLTCLTHNGKELSLAPNEQFDIAELHERTSLDDTQAVALHHALTHQIALIQGPPGTGKSYVGVALMRCLLANKQSDERPNGADIGPIVVVTYTNHALDQTLEHLHKAGVDQIVRIGGRSKSDILRDCNLWTLASKLSRTKHEKFRLYSLRKEKDVAQVELTSAIEKLKTANKTTFKNFICENWPDWCDAIWGVEEEEGWETVQMEDDYGALYSWIKRGMEAVDTPRSTDDLLYADPDSLTCEERGLIITFWQDQLSAELEDTLTGTVHAHEDIQTRLRSIDEDNKLRVLQAANVIGVTTSGLAKHLHILRKLQSQVLVCEEAGEVLEAHILTTVLPSITHAVLIGDHQQLRPNIQNYDLSSENPRGKQFSLDISLFERLIDPQPGIQRLPFCTLETQRRMHPTIARLVRDTLYPNLLDAPSVVTYPEVVGMQKRLYWLDHSHGEGDKDEEDVQTSHWNEYEVNMVVALVRHLISQGVYEPDDIAVLTPYIGQLQHLRHELGRTHAIVLNDKDVEELEEAEIDADSYTSCNLQERPVIEMSLMRTLRLATVDNFQGEEAKVIVLSLVRSNSQHNCGFLRTENRINVALSRAKHGMYIIGDSATASAKSSMWAQVTAMLMEDGNLGPFLELQCSRHPDASIAVAESSDFAHMSPEGGCHLQCGERLECGHKCLSKCHPEVMHLAVRCEQPCAKVLKSCGHDCQGKCGAKCTDRCMVNIHDPDRKLKCGHVVEDLYCWQSKQDPKDIDCPIIVIRTVPGCLHSVKVACHIDVNDVEYICTSPCSAKLPCGHECSKKCYECNSWVVVNDEASFVTNHGECQEICKLKHDCCGHSCLKLCHVGKECPPCTALCETSCSHTRCNRKCSETCRPCKRMSCASGCLHSRCTLPCAAPCNNLPCDKRCPKLLSCGHQCPSLCGEVCPSATFCQLCASDEILETAADLIFNASYRDIDLNFTPCIFPPCGHFFTYETIDVYIGMENFYVFDKRGGITDIKAQSSDLLVPEEMLKCRECRCSLQNVRRYGRIARLIRSEQTMKQDELWVTEEYTSLRLSLVNAEKHLANLQSSDHLKAYARMLKLGIVADGQSTYSSDAFALRHKHLVELRQRIERYSYRVNSARRALNPIDELAEIGFQSEANSQKLENDTVYSKAVALAAVLQHRCDILPLVDMMNIRGEPMEASITPPLARIDLSRARAACQAMVKIASITEHTIEQAEGLIMLAQFAAYETQTSRLDSASEFRALAEHAMETADRLVRDDPKEHHAINSKAKKIEKMLALPTIREPIWGSVMEDINNEVAVKLKDFRSKMSTL